MLKLITTNKTNKFIFAGLFVFILAVGFYFQSDIRQAVAKSFFERGSSYFSAENPASAKATAGKYDLDKAEKQYQKALAVYSELPNAHYQLARIYFIKANFQKALDEIDKEISVNSDNQRVYYIRGLINGYAKNYPSAAEDFKKFIESSPKEWAGYNDLAWIYYETGDYEKSKEAALKGLETNPENPWLLNGLSVILSKIGDENEFENVLRKAKLVAENLTEIDWQKAYPGNNPAVAAANLDNFKNNLGKEFAPACNSSVYWQCSGLSCSGFYCDPDHETCASNCATKCDCGPQTNAWINSSDGPLTLEQYAYYTLKWESCQSSCAASGSWVAGGLPSTGYNDFSDKIRGNYNYTITCNDVGEKITSDSVAVNVIKVPNCSFYADPQNIVALPATSTLFWDCGYSSPHQNESSADTCSIDQGIGSVNPKSGSQDVRPTETTTYTLTCAAQDGTKNYQTTVTIGYAPRRQEVNPGAW